MTDQRKKEIAAVASAIQIEMQHRHRIGHVTYMPTGQTVEALARVAIGALDKVRIQGASSR